MQLITAPTVTRRLRLAGGTEVLIRPLRPSDEAGWRRAVDRLSPESRRLRFAGPKPRLSRREAAYLLDVGHDGREAIVAIDVATGEGIGLARYGVLPDDPGAVDVAVVVADAWQGRGLGGRLLRALAGVAEAEGFERLTAMTLGENGPARRLLARLGFRVVAAGGGEVEYVADAAAVSGAARIAA